MHKITLNFITAQFQFNIKFYALQHKERLPSNFSWINYIRSIDSIYSHAQVIVGLHFANDACNPPLIHLIQW